MIHEDQIIILLLYLLDCLKSTACCICIYLIMSKQTLYDTQIDCIVIDNEYFCTGCIKYTVHLVFLSCLLRNAVRQPFPAEHLLRQRYRKCSPDSVDAVNCNLTAHHMYEFTRNRKSESRSLYTAIHLGIYLLKLVKYIGKILRLNTDTRVSHFKYQLNQIDLFISFSARHILQHIPCYLERYAALTSEFHAVIDQIDQHLTYPHNISVQAVRKVQIDVHLVFQTLVLSRNADDTLNIAEQIMQIIGNGNQLEITGFNLGYIQQIIDDCKQIVGSTFDVLCILLDLVRRICLQNQF